MSKWQNNGHLMSTQSYPRAKIKVKIGTIELRQKLARLARAARRPYHAQAQVMLEEALAAAPDPLRLPITEDDAVILAERESLT
jgi:hypothetical protein